MKAVRFWRLLCYLKNKDEIWQFTKWNLRQESAVEAEFFVPLVCGLVVCYEKESGGEHFKEASLYEPSQSVCPLLPDRYQRISSHLCLWKCPPADLDACLKPHELRMVSRHDPFQPFMMQSLHKRRLHKRQGREGSLHSRRLRIPYSSYSCHLTGTVGEAYLSRS